MERLFSREEAWGALSEARCDGATLGFVPTMGALHEGHLSLVRASRARTSATAVSLFVNPTQFSPEEDLSSIPARYRARPRAARGRGSRLRLHALGE